MNYEKPNSDPRQKTSSTPNLSKPESTELITKSPLPISKKLVLITIVLLILSGVCAAIIMLLRSTNTDNQATPQQSALQVKSPFEPLNEQLSDRSLLETALTRLMSVEAISYDVEAVGTYEANATFYLKKGERSFASTTTYHVGVNNATTDVIQKGNDLFFRYIKMPENLSEQISKANYLNKWVLVNENTSKGTGAGSEYLMFNMLSASSMDAPFVIGNITDPTKKLTLEAIKSGLYEIVSTSRVDYSGQATVKYSIKLDYKKFGKLLRDIYEAKDVESTALSHSYTMTAPGWGQSNEYDASNDTLTVWISPETAQPLGIDRFIDTGTPAFSSTRVIYSNMNFDKTSGLDAPTDFIPFNEFYPKS